VFEFGLHHKSKSHLITAYKVALIQKPIDEINSNLPILENDIKGLGSLVFDLMHFSTRLAG
jgi:hypothetical protein